jgi:hypothetical protein
MLVGYQRWYGRCCLESKLLEKVSASLGLLLTGNILLVEVPVVEELLQALLDINLTLSIDKVGFINSLLQVKIDNVTSGEDVTNIDILHKGLHCLGTLFDLFLGHGACDFSGSSCQASDEAVRVTLLTVTIVKGLDDDSLLTGMTPGKDNNNLSCLCKWEEQKLILCEMKDTWIRNR